MAVTKAISANPYVNGGVTTYCDGSDEIENLDSDPLSSSGTVAASNDPGPGGGRFFSPSPAAPALKTEAAVKPAAEPVKKAAEPPKAAATEPAKTSGVPTK